MAAWIVWLMIVGVIGCGLVCALKGKWGLAFVGLILPAPFWGSRAGRLGGLPHPLKRRRELRDEQLRHALHREEDDEHAAGDGHPDVGTGARRA